jgi:hypothetical protein
VGRAGPWLHEYRDALKSLGLEQPFAACCLSHCDKEQPQDAPPGWWLLVGDVLLAIDAQLAAEGRVRRQEESHLSLSPSLLASNLTEKRETEALG